MRFENVSIHSLAHFDAPMRVTSQEIDSALTDTYQRLGMPAGLLESLTGVRARRFWQEETQPSDAAALAGHALLEQQNFDRSRIGALISTSVCRDYVEPSVACFVHNRLGLSETCLNLDLSNACLGFVDGMQLVGNMIERGQIDYGLIVDGESSRRVVESTLARLSAADCDAEMFRQQIATLTVGSGAVAMLLGRSDICPDGHQFLGGVSLAATEHNQLCRGQLDVGITDTQNLLKYGVDLASRTWARAQLELGWESDSVDMFALHQVSHLHCQELSRALRFPLERAFLVYPEFGNVGPASIPLVLSHANQNERLNPGDRVVLGGIGSGLNCTAAGVIW
ncbi:MAG: 3-oxoacyl-ACP synthase III [Polyangiaceae bacterium]|nr:3-oxoacyl-ACP synthase III [Polyangiaceae bacterium]